MEKAWIPFAALLLVFSNSCTDQQTATRAVQFESEDYQVIFFSDDQNRETQEEYLDAILVLQNSEWFNQLEWNQQILKDDEIPDLSFHSYPALVILKNGQLVKTISGKESKEDIVNHVLEILPEQSSIQ
ncbi:MAG: hypothetical protein H0Z32_03010 [Bacillaceae bacterium]|nr:hypothetical protein [Bacillaceae bacterium]